MLADVYVTRADGVHYRTMNSPYTTVERLRSSVATIMHSWDDRAEFIDRLLAAKPGTKLLHETSGISFEIVGLLTETEES